MAAVNWATSLITTQGHSGITAESHDELVVCPILSLVSLFCFFKILHLYFFKKKLKQYNFKKYFGERQTIVGTQYDFRRVGRDQSFKRTILKKNLRSNKEIIDIPFFTRNFSKAFIDKLEAIVFKKEFEHEEIINQVICSLLLFSSYFSSFSSSSSSSSFSSSPSSSPSHPSLLFLFLSPSIFIRILLLSSSSFPILLLLYPSIPSSSSSCSTLT